MRIRPRSASSDAAAPLAPERVRAFAIAGTAFTTGKASPGLHLVATPIGNLGDITLRALETLAGADVVACEDTRVTRRLMERYAITTPLTPYHDHNAEEARPKLLARLARGEAVALVSDAGTPLISDPGFKLVRAARAEGHAVEALPGASSVLAALSLAGLPTDRFHFEGFLPAKEQARAARARELARLDATIVAFESGARLARALADLATAMGERDLAICRELTKLHEEVRSGRLGDLAAQADSLETRGEFVLVIGPPEARAPSAAELDALLRQALRQSSVKDAAALVASATGHARREVYARALQLAAKPATERDDDA
ncbi:MAG: 16S rRNA (cytidine(1402)-2'-O)-methyltransferase [Xanthobacteraceae bacterium]|nr:MAG: 16S rRNA (cytidine(1402)-2'-O)-methyltransferase [Xanthobacteraceae bacterium]